MGCKLQKVELIEYPQVRPRMRQHLAERGRRAVGNQNNRTREFGKAGWMMLHYRVPRWADCTDAFMFECTQPILEGESKP